MSPVVVSPRTTLAVIIGASDWPQSSLTGGPAFLNSAHAFASYLLDEKGFNLPREQMLDLFDDESSPSEMLIRIVDFLKAQIKARTFRDLIFYYVGHGLFQGADNQYCLAIRHTKTEFEDVTSLRIGSLARRLRKFASFQRRFLFLDSCFAGAATPSFQTSQVQIAIQKTAQAFPSRGTAVYCSSNKDDPSLAPTEHPYTMFSGALIQALRAGAPDLSPRLAMKDLDRLVWTAISEQFGEEGVRPELHCPDQREGDLGELPLFPNPGRSDQPGWKVKSVFQYGALSVSSSRGGALSLDGRLVKDMVPFEICHVEDIQAGSYKLEIKAAGVADVAERVMVRPNETQALDYDPPRVSEKKPPKPSPVVPSGSKSKQKTAPASPRKAGQIETFRDGGLEIEMAWRPPGEFTMGSPKNEKGRSSNETQHKVVLTKGFWLGRTPVTQSQWQAVMGENPSHFKGESRPVECVSWHDAKKFIEALNHKAGQEKFRLPSEAEWEYACRAGTTGPFAGELNDMGWHSENSGGETHDVGQKQPNAWDLHDMHGNVWEWCSDWYGAYSGQDETDPQGPSSGSGRVVRGGSWNNEARNCRSANRNRNLPDNRDNNLGFRLLSTERRLSGRVHGFGPRASGMSRPRSRAGPAGQTAKTHGVW